MFTLIQLHEAHAKVKSGADFPNYIKNLVALGVKAYDTYVADGHQLFTGADNFQLSTTGKYEPLVIAVNSSTELFKSFLQQHQQGLTDYPTFCLHAAICGVEKWTVDTVNMTCTYFDINGIMMITEKIPG